MPRQSSALSVSPARERLLDAVLRHFTAEGLGDQSLRQIAASAGTSHRMLLYHFGSREGLLVAVAQEVERRTQDTVAEIADASLGATDEVIRRVWSYVTQPELAPFERLFFALYGRALQGDDALAPLLEGDVARWLDANEELAAANGLDVPTALLRTHARLGLAVVRGLLLDLLATGERDEVTEALEVFARQYAGQWWERQPADAGRVAAGSGTSERAS
jgi:AcrR family transcriptional regulator